MRGSVPGFAAELGWDIEAFRKTFEEVSSKGMLRHDAKASLIWLPNYLKYNRPESPNVLKAWIFSIDLLPECNLKIECLKKLIAFAEGVSSSFQKVLRESLPEGFWDDTDVPLAEPEAEEEAVSETEKEKKYNATSEEKALPKLLEADYFLDAAAGKTTNVLLSNSNTQPVECSEVKPKPKTVKPRRAVQYTDEFEKRFWNVYPARNGKKIGKEFAFLNFQECIQEEDKEAFFRAVINYKNSAMVRERGIVRDPERFIIEKQGERKGYLYWREWLTPESKQTQPQLQSLTRDKFGQVYNPNTGMRVIGLPERPEDDNGETEFAGAALE